MALGWKLPSGRRFGRMMQVLGLTALLRLTLATWLRQAFATTWAQERTLRFVLATYGSGISLWWLEAISKLSFGLQKHLLALNFVAKSLRS